MKQFLRLLVSLTLVALAVHLLDVRSMFTKLRDVSPAGFMAAIIVNISAFLLLGARWHRIVASHVRLPFVTHLALYFKATFLNTFTPVNLGGDAYRFGVLRSSALPAREMLKLLFTERFIGLYGYFVTFIIAYVSLIAGLHLPNQAANPYSYGIALALGVVLLPLMAKPLGAALIQVARSIRGGELQKFAELVETVTSLLTLRGASWTMFLTLCGIALWIASIKLIAQTLAVSLPLSHIAAVAMLVEIVRLIPFTVQGIGLREAAFAYLLAFLGHNPEQCYLVGAVAYLALSVAIVLCGPLGQALTWYGRKQSDLRIV